MSLEILQIVPRLPPTISGVGDYAYLLAKQLRATHDVQTRFVVCDPEWENAESGKPLSANHQPSTTLDGFRIYQLKERSAEVLLRLLSAEGMPTTVLLQYVGYGYEKRGCPVWLVRGLEKWRSQRAEGRGQKSASRLQSSDRRHLVTMFHELYAFGPPWRSSFWASPLQRRITTHVANLSDSCTTTLQRYADWLTSRAPQHAGKVAHLSVFSTVGGISEWKPIRSCSPTMVIFSNVVWTRRIFEAHLNSVILCCRAHGLQEIVTIGSPIGTAPSNLPMAVKELGFIDAGKVAEVLSLSRVGMMDYAPGYLAKSTVFAAYAASCVPTVLPRCSASNADGIVPGKTCLLLEQLGCPVADEVLQQAADCAWQWYQTHSLERTAVAFAAELRQFTVAC